MGSGDQSNVFGPKTKVGTSETRSASTVPRCSKNWFHRRFCSIGWYWFACLQTALPGLWRTSLGSQRGRQSLEYWSNGGRQTSGRTHAVISPRKNWIAAPVWMWIRNIWAVHHLRCEWLQSAFLHEANSFRSFFLVSSLALPALYSKRRVSVEWGDPKIRS